MSDKPIVMRAEYAHTSNLTLVDTPGALRSVTSPRMRTMTRRVPQRLTVVNDWPVMWLHFVCCKTLS